jgi:hypothetical protein
VKKTGAAAPGAAAAAAPAAAAAAHAPNPANAAPLPTAASLAQPADVFATPRAPVPLPTAATADPFTAQPPAAPAAPAPAAAVQPAAAAAPVPEPAAAPAATPAAAAAATPAAAPAARVYATVKSGSRNSASPATLVCPCIDVGLNDPACFKGITDFCESAAAKPNMTVCEAMSLFFNDQVRLCGAALGLVAGLGLVGCIVPA